MTHTMPDDLWREFPRTATEFDERFATEEDCRAYWIKARWGGKPACAKCKSERVWTIRCGTTFECADCGHQTSLTSGTVLEKTRKPLKMWFRAIFEISVRRTGVSGKDFQRIMGFGSYETAGDVAAQAPVGDGPIRQRAARPFRRDGRGAGGRQGRSPQATRSGGGGKRRPRASRPRREQ